MIFQVEGRVSNYLDKIYFLLTKDVEREWKIPNFLEEIMFHKDGYSILSLSKQSLIGVTLYD